MPSLPSNWDVIVVGGGAAGLMAALELPAGLRVLLLSKDSAPRSASRWAQGGIAAVTRAEDSFESHLQDTLQAGGGISAIPQPLTCWCGKPRPAWLACWSWGWTLTAMEKD